MLEGVLDRVADAFDAAGDLLPKGFPESVSQSIFDGLSKTAAAAGAALK